MPYALVLFLPLISSIFQSAKNGVKNTAEGKYNTTIAWVLAAVGVYLIVTGWNKSKQQTYLDTAGTDKNTQQAQALRDAMNRSGISALMGIDGTDVDLIMQTGAQITDYNKVSDSYRVLYGSELTTDLQTELSSSDLQKFWNIVYKQNTSTGTTNTSLVGKNVTAKETVNVRNYDDYTKVDHQASKGDVIGTYVGEISLFLDGKTGVFVIVKSTSWLLFTTQYYVLKNSVTIA